MLKAHVLFAYLLALQLATWSNLGEYAQPFHKNDKPTKVYYASYP